MSIFQDTLDPMIAAQLKAREMVISQYGDTGTKDKKGNPIFNTGVTARQDKFLNYVAGKNAWVKMTSLVNYDSKIIKNGAFVDDNRYKGDQLAKKYVLEGGTLFNNSSLRFGVNNFNGGVYGGDLDLISKNDKKTRIDRLYGIRPMPGIESVNVTSVSAYGSLREATITFYAWDRHQLSELEILFMRPGYSVLLEWGWSKYLKHSDKVSGGINGYPDNVTIEDFTTGINVFDVNITDDYIQETGNNLKQKYCANYDYMVGFVKNFSWNFLPNGGFQCTTTLISRGEVLEGLKASVTSPVIFGSKDIVQELTKEIDTNRPVLSFFEKLFLNLIGYINSSEVTSNVGQLSPDSVGPDGEPIITTTEQKQSILQSTIEAGKNIIQTVEKRYPYSSFGRVNFPNHVIKPIDGGPNGSAIEYLRFDFFIDILNTYFIPKNDKNENVVTIIPYLDEFIITEDTVSVDPTTCLLRNPYATFLTGKGSDGFTPVVYENWTWNGTGFEGRLSAMNSIQSEISPSPNSLGQFEGIYISIQKIIDVYRELFSSDGVAIVDLLTRILDNINLALGGINDFKLHVKEKTIRIIDLKYLEAGKTKANKFIFDPVGLKSVCRDVRINSRIFSEMSTMIAIGAGTNEANNLGDVYSSTQTFFNKGLEDRLRKSLSYELDPKSTLKIGTEVIKGEMVRLYQMASNVLSLRNHIKYKVLGVPEYQNKPVDYNVTYVPSANEVINASSLLQTIHYQIDGNDIDYKALIPYELEIELDGITSPTIGQIIRLSPDVLPKDYYNKNIGFVIMKISHSLKNNDWVTTLGTQICLLDTDEIVKSNTNKKKLLNLIEKIITTLQKTSYIKYAMADYLIYLTYISIFTTEKEPTTQYSQTINITPEFLKIENLNKKISLPSYNFVDFLNKWIAFWRGTQTVFLDLGSPNCKEGFNVNNLTDFPTSKDDIYFLGNDGDKIDFNYNQFQGWTYASDSQAENDTFLQTTSDTRPGFEKIDPFLEAETLSPFLKKYIQQKDITFFGIQGETNISKIFTGKSNYINVKNLYTYYLGYIQNKYLTQTSNESFAGAGTEALSVWFGGDDTKNAEYYGGDKNGKNGKWFYYSDIEETVLGPD